MYTGLLHLHNLLRWVVLLLLVATIARAIIGMVGKKPFEKTDRILGLILMNTAHIQLLIGLYQWFTGAWGLKNIQNLGMGAVMKDATYRFWAVEHFGGMLLAIILITLGRGIGKRNLSDAEKHKRSMWVYMIALFIILAVIPWPERVGVGRSLFPGMSH